MKIVSLDVHAEASQMTVLSEHGEVIFEMKTPTEREALRAVVAGTPSPKRVVFEEGPLSAMLHDWLADVADEIVSCDPARNALIARSEDSSDERGARRLGHLRRERVAAHRVIGKWAKQVPVIDRLETIPGVGPITARTPVGPARASKRGNRALKRVLFLAAQAATRGKNALARRYTARREAGWRHGKAPRDLARTLLMIAWCLWKKGVQYDDRRIAALSAD